MRRKCPVSTVAFPMRLANSSGEQIPESTAVLNNNAELSLSYGTAPSPVHSLIFLFFANASSRASASNRSSVVQPTSFG